MLEGSRLCEAGAAPPGGAPAEPEARAALPPAPLLPALRCGSNPAPSCSRACGEMWLVSPAGGTGAAGSGSAAGAPGAGCPIGNGAAAPNGLSTPSSALWRCNAASARNRATGGRELALREGSMGAAMGVRCVARFWRECDGVPNVGGAGRTQARGATAKHDGINSYLPVAGMGAWSPEPPVGLATKLACKSQLPTSQASQLCRYCNSPSTKTFAS